MDFFEKIEKFNQMYNMPKISEDPNRQQDRLNKFEDILSEELNEIHDNNLDPHTTDALDFKVALSDLLGDLIVYCASEARRWDIDIKNVLDIIMESNFSKLDENGNPIYDERGKLLKGPNYWKPESRIADLFKNK